MSRSDNGIFPFPIGIPFRAARLKNDRGIVSHKAFAVRSLMRHYYSFFPSIFKQNAFV